MKVACLCQVNPTVEAVLCVRHVFLLPFTAVQTTMYYDLGTDQDEAMADCHAVALQTANLVLKQYHVELSEEQL